MSRLFYFWNTYFYNIVDKLLLLNNLDCNFILQKSEADFLDDLRGTYHKNLIFSNNMKICTFCDLEDSWNYVIATVRRCVKLCIFFSRQCIQRKINFASEKMNRNELFKTKINIVAHFYSSYSFQHVHFSSKCHDISKIYIVTNIR